jgi:hypothetical protein
VPATIAIIGGQPCIGGFGLGAVCWQIKQLRLSCML